MRTIGSILIGLLLAWGLAGCGGGGGNGGNTGTDTGTLIGSLNVANAANYRIILDGRELDAAPEADGDFTVPNLPPGDHTLTLVDDSGFTGITLPIIIEPGDDTNIGDVDPSAGGEITGTVTHRADDDTVTPLAGVTVIADLNPPVYAMASTAAVRTRQASECQYSAVTDSAGKYTIPAVPEGVYLVSVSVPGLRQAMAYVFVSAGQSCQVDLELLTAVEQGVGTVKGHVRASLESGVRPLEGAFVSVMSDQGWEPVPPVNPVPLPDVVRDLLGLLPAQADEGGDDVVVSPPLYVYNEFSTLSAADGSYTLNVPSGHLQITVWAEGYDFVFDTFTLQPRATVTRDYTLQVFDDIPVEPPVDPPVEPGAPGTG